MVSRAAPAQYTNFHRDVAPLLSLPESVYLNPLLNASRVRPEHRLCTLVFFTFAVFATPVPSHRRPMGIWTVFGLKTRPLYR